MARFYTLSVSLSIEKDYDIIEALEKYKKKGGNISELVRELLRQYFFLNVEVSDKTMVELIKMRKEIDNAKDLINEAMHIISNVESRVKDLENKISEIEDKKEEDKTEQSNNSIKINSKAVDDWLKEFLRR